MSVEVTMIKNIEQKRAKFAYECAEKGCSISTPMQIGSDWYQDKHYKTYVKKIPALIKMNGLAATYAYIFSKREKGQEKKKNAYDLIYEQTTEWLRENGKYLIDLKNKELIEELISLDSATYRAITIEILSLFNWLRRFAEGMSNEEVE